jgi:hypothetical protein
MVFDCLLQYLLSVFSCFDFKIILDIFLAASTLLDQVQPQVLRRREVRAQGGDRDVMLRISRDNGEIPETTLQMAM